MAESDIRRRVVTFDANGDITATLDERDEGVRYGNLGGDEWDDVDGLRTLSQVYVALSEEDNAQRDADEAEYVAAIGPRRCKEVDALRDRKLAIGFVDAATGKTWQCDPDSIGKWTAMGGSAGIAVLMSLSPTFYPIAADNSVPALTASDTFALFNGRVMPWVSATVLYGRGLKDQILAAEDPMSVDIETGWPN